MLRSAPTKELDAPREHVGPVLVGLIQIELNFELVAGAGGCARAKGLSTRVTAVACKMQGSFTKHGLHHWFKSNRVHGNICLIM